MASGTHLHAYANAATFVTFGVGVAIAIAAATAGYFAIKALTGGGSSSGEAAIADDMFSEGGYGKRTLLGPEGAIKLNDKDDIVAGTDLFDKQGTSGGGGMSGAKLDKITNLLERILSKEGGVYIDGNKVGATIALTNYEQQ